MWRQLLTQPDQAAHAVGKILSRVGQKRVMWGTDAIWYGSPQPQIMAMRAFQITPEYQERYGYPALTDEIESGHLRRQRRRALRARSHGHPLRPGHRSPAGQRVRNGPTAGRRSAALALASARPDHPTSGPKVARRPRRRAGCRHRRRAPGRCGCDRRTRAEAIGDMAPVSEDQLIDRSVALAAELLVAARAGTSRRELRRQLRLRRLLASDSGTRLVFSLADRVLRPTDARTAAGSWPPSPPATWRGSRPSIGPCCSLAALAARPAPRPVVALVASPPAPRDRLPRLPGRTGPARAPPGPAVAAGPAPQPQPPG